MVTNQKKLKCIRILTSNFLRFLNKALQDLQLDGNRDFKENDNSLRIYYVLFNISFCNLKID